MPTVKYAKIVEELMQKPLFTAKELEMRGVPPSYIKRLANLLKKKGKISIVEKGKYAVVDNPFLVAPFLTFPSYISMFSALFLRETISQVPMTIQIVTTRKRKNKKVVYNDTEIEFFKIKKELFFGFEYIWHEGYQIPIAKTEKAIFDALYFGFSITDVDIDFSKIDCTQVIDYFRTIGKKSVLKKLRRSLKC